MNKIKSIMLCCTSLLLLSCTTFEFEPNNTLPKEKQHGTAVSPPTYVRVLQQKPHPDLEEIVSPLHLVNTNIENALLVAFPFPITVQSDHSVDKDKKHSYRVANETTVSNLLNYISHVSGHSLRYDPSQKMVLVSKLVNKSWSFPTLVGRGHTEVSLGSSDDDEDDSGAGGTNNESNTQEDSTIATRYDSRENIEWNNLVEQVYCALSLPACSGSEEDDLTTDSDEADQSVVGRRAKDGSFAIISSEHAMITVHTTPSKMRELDMWLSALEKSLLRFVRVQVALINVRKSNVDQRGINFQALLTPNNDQLNIAYRNDFTERSGGVLTASGTLASGDLTLTSLLQLITRQTDSQVLQRVTLLLAGGETSALKAVETFYFNAGSDILPGDNNNQQVVTSELQQESVGIEVVVTPRFINPYSDEISIRVIPVISRLVGFDEITSDSGNTTRAPRISLNNFTTHAILRDGQALVVGGFITRGFDDIKNTLPISIPLINNRDQEFVESEIYAIVTAEEIET